MIQIFENFKEYKMNFQAYTPQIKKYNIFISLKAFLVFHRL